MNSDPLQQAVLDDIALLCTKGHDRHPCLTICSLFEKLSTICPESAVVGNAWMAAHSQ